MGRAHLELHAARFEQRQPFAQGILLAPVPAPVELEQEVQWRSAITPRSSQPPKNARSGSAALRSPGDQGPVHGRRTDRGRANGPARPGGSRPGPGQPDRRSHRLQRRLRPAARDRPVVHRRGTPGGGRACSFARRGRAGRAAGRRQCRPRRRPARLGALSPAWCASWPCAAGLPSAWTPCSRPTSRWGPGSRRARRSRSLAPPRSPASPSGNQACSSSRRLAARQRRSRPASRAGSWTSLHRFPVVPARRC